MTTLASSPKEIMIIGINKPTPFDGNPKNLNIFIRECRIYLERNDAAYDTDDKKIVFILFHMTEKMQQWKDIFIQAHTNKTTEELDLPTYPVFIDKLKEDFKTTEYYDQEALFKLYHLKQGNRTAEELVAEIRFLARKVGLGFQTHSDHIHMIQLFQKALNPQLVRRILLSNEVPEKIDGWFNRAIQLDTVSRRFPAIFRNDKKSPRKEETETRNRSWNFSKPTAKNLPNTMDNINAMSQQERADLMKNGACFNCKKRGHRARDCPPEENSSGTPEKKWTPKEIHAIIQAMTKEERAEIKRLLVAESLFERARGN